ncbi:hypothetical protein T12_16040 [Trichinella patagoniensis]|uniref:Uncharacterized protein n=1 Tax=Trichinella patagoniensis TaxID=990121 RepID=A0A0V0WCQ2_9BILA|nr:hypothetical protein T12_4758 [Trichinella patagoniensis]KRX74039.1 hypothetical protein T12_16040 [Trichinella patagoniensis]
MLIRVLACLKQALRVGIIGSTEKRVKVITGYMNCSSS